MKTKILAIACAAFVFIACDSAPSCDDSDVKNLLTQTYNKNVPSTKHSTITYKHFFTDFKDDKAKKVSCKAKAVFNPAVNGVDEEDIEYISYITDDEYLYIELKSELISEKQWKETIDNAIDEGMKEFEKEWDKIWR